MNKNVIKTENVKASSLLSKIKHSIKMLKKEYKRVVENLPDNQNEQVLYDNFYIIQKMGKTLSFVDKKALISLSKNGRPLLGEIVLNSCIDDNLPESEKLICALNERQKDNYIKNEEFELLVWEFRYVLVEQFIENFLAEKETVKSPLEIVVLLTKSDCIDMPLMIEKCNQLDIMLSKEWAEVYSKMSDKTKSIYRNRVSKIAEKFKIDELALAQKYLEKSLDDKIHIGELIYYDYDVINGEISPKIYISIIMLSALIFSICFSILAKNLWIALLLIIPFIEVSKTLIELFLRHKNEVTYLPRIDFDNKIPNNAKTLVVISTLITSTKDIQSLKNKLMNIYHTNPFENLQILALCDLKEYALPSSPDDKMLVRNCKRLIKKLNEKYGDKFNIIVRSRSFCKTQNVYSGFERKRGAIEQLVKFIKNDGIEFLCFAGDIDFIKSSKYILTLDADTKPLMDTIPELVSIAMHPLNTPIIENNHIAKGFGIITPRMTSLLKSSIFSPFTKLIGGIGSSCAYDTNSAEIYQDTFGFGIFSGKGLIDIDCYYRLCCDKFKTEQVLSHDILEGEILKTAYASDVEFSDSFPSYANSYFKRMHRWIRGDIQNAGFVFDDKNIGFDFLSKIKIADNIRRAIQPISIALLFIFAIFTDTLASGILTSIAVITLFLPYVISFVSSLSSNGFFSLARKFYSKNISQTTQILMQAFFSFLLLPQNALYSADATIRSLYRKSISKKNLLQWTTAAQAEKSGFSFYSFFCIYLSPLIFGLALLISNINYLKLIGLIYLISPIILGYINVPYYNKKADIPNDKKEELLCQLTAMIQFYEDYAKKSDNYLPPDNVQLAPVFRVCHRTSPTNIGLMMLSYLVARDFDIIDSVTLCRRLNNTISSIEKLEKVDGNLYNWYETNTLKPCSSPYVSSVDSGNFLCCLVSLKEGLKEYRCDCEKVDDIVIRIEKILNSTDIGFFYDDCKDLLSIGYNPQTKEFSPNHYDLLMSESRMMSYYAIAKRQIPKKHWCALGRTLGKSGLHSGAISYSGTMFEFFMPELFLNSEPASLSYESLKFCIHCQKKYALDKKVPYGISESGYFAFDSMLNYQYKAHGVPFCGIKKGLENDLVISPYSTYLTLEYDFNDAFNNLKKFKSIDMYGKYGFFEAIDYTNQRASEKGSIVKSYMAHHIGMSVVALSNTLQNKRNKKRFMKDKFMSSASELLQEKIMPDNILLDNIYRKPETQRIELDGNEDVLFQKIIATQPNVKLLCNGEYTLALTDSGLNIALYQGRDVYIRTTDILRKPQGCFFAIQTQNDVLHFSYLPEFKNSDEMSVEFSSDSVSYYSNNGEINAGMKVQLHNSLPCEIRQFAIKNTSSKAQTVSLMGYIQPILCSYSEHYAHPAFSKLFLKLSFDYEHNVIIAHRQNRDDNSKLFFAVGFVEEVKLFCNLSNEEILKNIIGVKEIFSNASEITESYNSIPDPAIFLKTDILLSSNEKRDLNLFVLTALSHEELLNNIAKLRNDKYIYTLSTSKTLMSSIEGRLVNTLLPQILFKRADCKEQTECIHKNVLSAKSLWEFGISGDAPIILVEMQNIQGRDRVVGYLKAFNVLFQCHIKFDLVFAFDDKDDSSEKFEDMLLELIKENQMEQFLRLNGGIHLFNIDNANDEILVLLKAIAIHIAPQSMVRIQSPAKEFSPIKIMPVNKKHFEIKNKLSLGGFDENHYIIDEQTQVPWCDILANKTFGTLVSNNSLGYTYAINSRENKLTPWENDTQYDNRGEMLLLKCDDKYYDLVWGATAIFSPEKAEYFGECELFKSKVSVGVSDKAMTKKISLEITWKAKRKDVSIAFYTEPVLGVSRDNSRMNVFEFDDNSIIVCNPLNSDIKGYMTIHSSKKVEHYTTDKNEFFSGRWENNSLGSSNFSCASLIIDESFDNNKTKDFDFFISFAKNREASKTMHKYFEPFKIEKQNSIVLNTPDKNLNDIFNTWLYWQAVGGRIYARTGFYQNSGAYGFRDQLQDACGCILQSPEIAKRQIIRCCTVQFEDGDVLHWWHKLPNDITRGIRTKFSDDLVWLPYAVCEYIEKTDDYKLLAMNLNYCKGIELDTNEQEKFGEVVKSDKIQSVYNHCRRAIEKAFKLGEHDLILMGCGDWNDSFNKVGEKGKGESVWLSQFMIIVLKRFAKIAKKMGDLKTKNDYLDKAEILEKAIEENCWDGEWYLRAFFDNGDELGSKHCEACQIDSLAQSFATLSNLENKERNEIALQSAYEYLVDKRKGIIKLFSPAFDKSDMPVGYATAYPRGIRENGGQYTHGAIWLAIAYLENLDTEKGFELLQILNPANKYLKSSDGKIFKNEPYFMTADIYTNPQCYGRGGWSIYTGATAWYYRAISEWFLGIKICGNQIDFQPHLPADWEEYSADVQYKNTFFHIEIMRGKKSAKFDNDKAFDKLTFDGKTHNIRIILQ